MENDDTRRLRNDIHEVSANVTRILSYIESDPRVKKEGLIEQVNRIDEEVDKLKNVVFKLYVIAAVITTLLQVLWFLYSEVFKTQK